MRPLSEDHRQGPNGRRGPGPMSVALTLGAVGVEPSQPIGRLVVHRGIETFGGTGKRCRRGRFRAKLAAATASFVASTVACLPPKSNNSYLRRGGESESGASARMHPQRETGAMPPAAEQPGAGGREATCRVIRGHACGGTTALRLRRASGSRAPIARRGLPWPGPHLRSRVIPNHPATPATAWRRARARRDR